MKKLLLLLAVLCSAVVANAQQQAVLMPLVREAHNCIAANGVVYTTSFNVQNAPDSLVGGILVSAYDQAGILLHQTVLFDDDSTIVSMGMTHENGEILIIAVTRLAGCDIWEPHGIALFRLNTQLELLKKAVIDIHEENEMIVWGSTNVLAKNGNVYFLVNAENGAQCKTFLYKLNGDNMFERTLLSDNKTFKAIFEESYMYLVVDGSAGDWRKISKFDLEGNLAWESNVPSDDNGYAFGFSSEKIVFSSYLWHSGSGFTVKVTNVDKTTGVAQTELTGEQFLPLEIFDDVTVEIDEQSNLYLVSNINEKKQIILSEYLDGWSYQALKDVYVTEDQIFFTGNAINDSLGTIYAFVQWMELSGITGIHPLEQNATALVFPNPTNGTITVRTEEDDCKITITDLFGKMFFSGSVSRGETRIDPYLAPGVYLVQVGTKTIRLVVP